MSYYENPLENLTKFTKTHQDPQSRYSQVRFPGKLLSFWLIAVKVFRNKQSFFQVTKMWTNETVPATEKADTTV